MPQKYRLTGCAKFFFFLIIAAPLAYFGANYWNTGDALSGLKDLGIVSDTEEPAVKEQVAPTDDTADLQTEVERLRAELEACKGQMRQDSTNKNQ